jgi:hypothetical protein
MPNQTRKYVEMGKKLKSDIEGILAKDTILIFPNYPSTVNLFF